MSGFSFGSCGTAAGLLWHSHQALGLAPFGLSIPNLDTASFGTLRGSEARLLIGCRREAMFLRTQRNLPCIMPFEGGFISCYPALCVSSIRALRRYLTCSSSVGLLFSSAVAIGDYTVLMFRIRLSGRHSPSNMPCRLRGSGFCRDVSRGTLLVNSHEAH